MSNPTMYLGVETTQNPYALTDALVRQVLSKVMLREAEIAPIYTITQAMSTKQATQFQVEWFEDVMKPHTDTTSGAVGDTTTKVIPVSNDVFWNVDDYVLDRTTGELMGPITSIDLSGHTITVGKRGVSTDGPAQNIGSGDLLFIMDGNIKEGGDPAEAIQTVPTKKVNLLQRWSHSIKVTKTLDNVNFYWGSERVRQGKKKWLEHREAIELATIFGQQANDPNPSTYGDRMTMRGILKFISTNVKTIHVGSGKKFFTEDDWNDWLRQLFYYGGTEKTIFCSGEVLNMIAKFGLQGMHLRPGDDELGLSIQTYVSPFGKVHLVYHRFFTAAYNLDWFALALDMSRLVWDPLEATIFRQQIQPPQSHFIWDEYYTEGTLEFYNEEHHGYLQVVT